VTAAHLDRSPTAERRFFRFLIFDPNFFLSQQTLSGQCFTSPLAKKGEQRKSKWGESESLGPSFAL